jgi:uncharacterized membrane protein YphA (DoxX/SURF4 family)
MPAFDQILRDLPMLLAAAMVAILFLQSGLDKVTDWSGNLEWLTGHFSKTFLAGMVPMMLGTITIMEIATGLLSAVGIVYYVVSGSSILIFWGGVIGAVSILSLFFGQRVAKDYPGAAVLVPYFILLLILIILSQPNRAVVTF